MFIGESKNPVAIPEQSLPLLNTPKKVEKGEETVDFDKLLLESNVVKKGEIEREKKTVGDGEFHVGETKNDKDFREQLEKITGKKLDKAKNKLDQNDYLTLLVTQLKYQDPSKPMEHYEMASQMAQFNTVEQLVGVNKSLTNMNKSQSEAKLDKLSQYLEKYVEVQGNNLKLNPDKTTSISRFELPTKGSSVNLEIKDAQAKVVRSMNLGELQMGTHDVKWDGKDNQGKQVSPGNYTFNIIASTEDGKAVTAKTSYLAKVSGVTDILGGGKLESTAGSIDPEKIISVRNLSTLEHVLPKPPPIQQANSLNQVKNIIQDKGEEAHGGY